MAGEHARNTAASSMQKGILWSERQERMEWCRKGGGEKEKGKRFTLRLE